MQTHQDGGVVTIFDADLFVPIFADDDYSPDGSTLTVSRLNHFRTIKLAEGLPQP